MHRISRNPQGMSLGAATIANKGAPRWMTGPVANVNSPSLETGTFRTGESIKDPYQALLTVLGLS